MAVIGPFHDFLLAFSSLLNLQFVVIRVIIISYRVDAYDNFNIELQIT